MAQTLAEAFLASRPPGLAAPADDRFWLADLDRARDVLERSERVARDQEREAAGYVAYLTDFVGSSAERIADLGRPDALAQLDEVIAQTEQRADRLAKEGARLEKEFRRRLRDRPEAVRATGERLLASHATVVEAMLDCALGLRALKAEKAHDPATDRTFTDAAGLEAFLRSIHAA